MHSVPRSCSDLGLQPDREAAWRHSWTPVCFRPRPEVALRIVLSLGVGGGRGRGSERRAMHIILPCDRIGVPRHSYIQESSFEPQSRSVRDVKDYLEQTLRTVQCASKLLVFCSCKCRLSGIEQCSVDSQAILQP